MATVLSVDDALGVQLGLRLTPHGNLVLEGDKDSPSLDETVAARLIRAFLLANGKETQRAGENLSGR